MADALAGRTLRELARVLFTRWLTILLIVVIAAGATWYACQISPKYYRCQVALQVRQPRTNPTVRPVSPDRSLQVFVRTQREIILSNLVLARAMAQKEAALAGAQIDAAGIDEAAAEILKTRREDLRRFRRKVKVETPGGTDVAMSEVILMGVDQADAPGIEPGRTAYLAAKAVADQYKRRFSELQARANTQATESIRQRLRDLRKQLIEPAERALHRFLDEDLINPSDIVILEQLARSGTEAGGQIVRTTFQQELIRISGRLAEEQGLLREVVSQLPAGLVEVQSEPEGSIRVETHLDRLQALSDEQISAAQLVVPERVLRNNDIINKLKKKLADLLIERNRLEIQFTTEYRPLQDLRKEIARVQRQIASEMMAEARAIGIRIRTMQDRYRQIESLLSDETEDLDRISALFVAYQTLKNDLDNAQKQYAYLQRQLIDAESAQQQAREAITVLPIDEPVVSDRPVYPRPVLYTVVAAAAGLLFALALAFVADYFDHTLRTSGDAQRYLGLPVLASVRQMRRGMVRRGRGAGASG